MLKHIAVVVLGSTVLTGCGVALTDQTVTPVPRNATAVYDVAVGADVVGATIDRMIAEITPSRQASSTFTTVTLTETGDGVWTGTYEGSVCDRGFGVDYVADYKLKPLGSGTEREPAQGVHFKWIAGVPPSEGCERVPTNPAMTVNMIDDEPDFSPEDGVCAIAEVTTGENPDCSLRAAVMEANARPGPDLINIPEGTYRLQIRGAWEDDSRTGDLDIRDSVTLAGAGVSNTTIDAEDLRDRVFHIHSGSPQPVVEITDLVLRNGRRGVSGDAGDPGGGGVFNTAILRMDRTLVEDNEGRNAGGIVNNGWLALIDSGVIGNSSTAGAGGIFNGPSDYLLLAESSIRNNGGELRAGGGIQNRGRLDVRNSTISANTTDRSGGGLYNASSGEATFRNATIYKNEADERGDGIYNSGGEVTVANTVLACNNSSGSCSRSRSEPECFGDFRSVGHNFLSAGDPTCRFNTDFSLGGDQVGPTTAALDPQLDDASGPAHLPIHRPMAGSPLIDQGANVPPSDARVFSCSPRDQQGQTRPQGVRCDIGAIEF